MTALQKATYPLIFSILTLSSHAFGVETINRQPIAKLSVELKKSGHKRIAQGLGSVISKDSDTGKVFHARSPLMLTKKADSSEWTISVLHDKQVGSTLFIGSGLEQPQRGEIPNLSSFNRKVAEAIIPKLESYGAAYYPDEVKRLKKEHGFKRLFTGTIKLTTHPKFQNGPKLVFVDILVDAKKDFTVLAVDKNGVCYKMAFGSTFTEKR